MAIAINQLINYNLHPSVRVLYFRAKAYEILSLYFNRPADIDVEQCPFLTDEENVDNIYGVFSKSYNDFYYSQGRSFDTISTWVYDNDATDGTAGQVNNSSTGTWNLGVVEEGAYVALIRMKRQTYGRCRYYIEDNNTKKESYGYNIGNGTGEFYVDIDYRVYALPFNINFQNSIDLNVDVPSLDSGNGYIDFAMVIPLSNGQDYVFDLMLQNLAIFDQEYVGVIK